jgi:molybdenum cofactor cytidylyltransferase
MISIQSQECHMPDPASRIFALIPAAGRSRRMKSPKLSLPWNGSTVIEHLIQTLACPEVYATIVVVRPDDVELQTILRRTSVTIVVPDHEPPQMRDSIEIGLRAIREEYQPGPRDAWLLIPADHPLIEKAVLNAMLRAWRESSCSILVPKFGDHRGHPALLSWSMAEQIPRLPPNVGINALWHANPRLITELPTDHESVLADLDTPEDYARWHARLATSSR